VHKLYFIVYFNGWSYFVYCIWFSESPYHLFWFFF
jgi:hypothetical protein